MKVILLKDTKNVGKKDQILEVKDGYAKNFLFPNKLAVPYTQDNIENLNDQKAAEAARLEALKKEAIEIQEKLKNVVVEFKAKSGKGGAMIGTISAKQVELELLNKFGIKIDKRKISNKSTVNAFGYTNLEIELFKGVIGIIRVHVSEDK